MRHVVDGALNPESASKLLSGYLSTEVVAKFQKVVESQPLWAADCLLENCRRETTPDVRLNALRVLASLENIPKAFCDKAQNRIVDGIIEADSEELSLVLIAATNLVRNQDIRVLKIPERERAARALDIRFDDIQSEADRIIAARCSYYLGKTGQEQLLKRFQEAPGARTLSCISVALQEESSRVIEGQDRSFAQLAHTPLTNYLGLCSKALVSGKRNEPGADSILVRCCAELGSLAADQIVETLAAKPGSSPLEERVLSLMLGDGLAALERFFRAEAVSNEHSTRGINNVLKVSERILGNLISLGTVHEVPRMFQALADVCASPAGYGNEPAVSRLLHVSVKEFDHFAKAHPANEAGQLPFLFENNELVGSVRQCIARAVSTYAIDRIGEMHGHTRTEAVPDWLAEMVETAKSTFVRDSKEARVAQALYAKIESSGASPTLRDLQEFLLQLNATQEFLRS